MTVNIQYVHIPTSESLSTIINNKLDKMAKKYNWVISTQVFLKLEKDPTGKGKICEMEVSGPGPRIFAKSNEDDFEKAVVATIHDLERQLKKRKEIFHKHH
ncbi:putative sigma-54 modulation protein [Saonia flava]|uniref:Putative sigma-54 modulation protein n=1 Tax=Saonia flava TaxID=523696 RepID=A0A846R5X3_9FLAO|nr:ribosome-associated translation inhibitor RaiA [Saonia flava]NJB72179.1 putative sigma-54 modulation protein [Saonia flava]